MQRPPQQNMPKFNLNWVYAIIIGVLLVLFFTGGGGTGVDKNVSYSVFTQYLSKGYAHRLEVNKSDGTLKMFVEGKHIQDVFHETSKETGKNPTVSTTYGSLDKLQERLDAETKAGHFKGTVTYVQDSNMMWNIILNILLFLPFGYLLQTMFPRLRWWQVILLGLAFSLCIELLQLITKLGYADVDDLINNTLGAAIGWLCYKLILKDEG